MSAPPSEHLVATSVHGRYLLDRPAGAASGLLMGFHGYAETAGAQLDRLRAIAGGGWTLASVQALHPFYRGRTDEVVAGWMTRLDREHAIADNLGYVAAVLADIAPDAAFDPVVYAGFSQGVAMAFRAALRGPRRGPVIALGGDVPPDVKDDDPSRWRDLPVLLGRGTRDPWLDEHQFERDAAFLREAGAALTTVVFEGGHEWGPPFSAAAAPWLAGLAR